MKTIGTTQPIHDAKSKATGRAIYAGDMYLKDMVYAAVLYSDIPHGIVKAIDDTKALAIEGVLAVLHCFNTTENKFNRYRNFKGQGMKNEERIFNDHVRFVGDRVALVIAKTQKIATLATKLIEVTYEKLPHTFTVEEAMSGKIDCIHEDGAVYGDLVMELGDETIKPSEDDIVVESTSHLARIHHLAMEPHACVADFNNLTGELTVWSPNQSVFGIRSVLAELFEMPYEKVRVIKTTMGGSFGAKQEWMLEPIAAVAALKIGRPVKLVFSRKEAIISTICRFPIDAKLKSYINNSGEIKYIKADVTLDAGGYLGSSYDYMAAIASKFYRCYKFNRVSYTGRSVCTNAPVSGAFRGWSAPEIAIMLEHNLNMAARKLNIDPIDIRLSNIADSTCIDKKSGYPLLEVRIKECIELGKKQFDWERKKTENSIFNSSNSRFKRGISIACGGHVNGYFPREKDFAGIHMKMTESGGVIAHATLHDHGCGTVTAFKMIIAEALEIPIDKVVIGEGDTSYTPVDIGCYASRTTFVIGKAAMDCAYKLKDQLLEYLAQAVNKNNDFYVKDAIIYSQSDENINMSYEDAIMLIYNKLQKEVWVKHQHVSDNNPAVTGAHFCNVQVDTSLGNIKILEYLAVHDVGQVINYEMCVAQIQGAVLMGSGAAISEHISYNEKTGAFIESMKDYHVINCTDAPNVEVILLEGGNTSGPFGAKSIGEVSHVPVAPCIIGAVNDALQSDLCHMPLNQDKILAWLKSRRDN